MLLVGVGAVIAVFVFLWYDQFLQKNRMKGKIWAQSEEYRRLPLACAGGPLYAISLFWLVGLHLAKIPAKLLISSRSGMDSKIRYPLDRTCCFRHLLWHGH